MDVRRILAIASALPFASTTRSFHGFPEMDARSAWVTIVPSASRRSSRRCAESTTSRRPSGRKSMHIGNDGMLTTTSWRPAASSAIT